jgi:hypothetical protein
MQDFFANGTEPTPPQPTTAPKQEETPKRTIQKEEKKPEKQPVKEPTEFKAAASIEEAEEFAKSFMDLDAWGSVGVSYKGVDVNVANVVNETVFNFYKTYDVEKFRGVCAPAGNTKLGKAIKGATAAYSPIQRSILLNRESLKTLEIADKGFQAERQLAVNYLKDPSRYKVSSESAKRVLELSRTSGRATVPLNVQEAVWHELGHSLERSLRSASNYDKIKAGFAVYGERISGYAASDFSEYIAESFCAWNIGEDIDPELVSAFEGLKR